MNTKIDLKGLWDFVVDLDPKYHVKRSYARPDWDRRNWAKVPVPGVWNKYAERYDIFEGVGWFAREFSLPSIKPGTTALLRFGAVNYLCEVFVNGRLAGTHEGGYTEFVLNVSEFIAEGANSLAVRVDNRAHMMKLPPVLGYFNYGGIHRDVALELYAGAYISELSIDAAPVKNGGQLSVTGVVSNMTGTSQIEVSCHGATARATPDAGGRFHLKLSVPDVQAWAPEHPHLYAMHLSLDKDRHQQDFEIGFRTISTKGTSIELNGKPFQFRGICYLYDSPAYGIVLRPEQYEADLALLQEMGVNAIRSHFPFSHDFLSACDRRGILVWIETPVYCIDPQLPDCRDAFTDETWLRLASTMLEEMIRQSKLHPSVCIYGIGNECQLEAPGAEKFFSQLAAHARTLDSTRPLSYACLYGLAGAIAGIVDIVGFNEYWGWYDVCFEQTQSSTQAAPAAARTVDLAKLKEMLQQQAAQFRKPVLLTEFGADSVPGYRSGSLDLWSEDYHAQVLRETIAIAAETPFICGAFPFAFSDYRDPSKEITGRWDGMNYKGVVSYHRQRKYPFHVLQEIYRKHAPNRS